MQVILEWGSRQQKPVFGVQLSDSLGSLRIFIFNFVSLIDDNILPLELHQCTHANSHTFESCDANIKIAGSNLSLDDLLSALLLGNEIDDFAVWEPAIEF
jgi:hypothetical protein